MRAIIMAAGIGSRISNNVQKPKSTLAVSNSTIIGHTVELLDKNGVEVAVVVGYKKNYIYLNSYTLYVVEDISGTHTDPYHYKVYFDTNVIPSVEVK